MLKIERAHMTSNRTVIYLHKFNNNNDILNRLKIILNWFVWNEMALREMLTIRSNSVRGIVCNGKYIPTSGGSALFGCGTILFGCPAYCVHFQFFFVIILGV